MDKIYLVGGVGFEPTTSRLWASRAARLLYPPTVLNIVAFQRVSSIRVGGGAVKED